MATQGQKRQSFSNAEIRQHKKAIIGLSSERRLEALKIVQNDMPMSPFTAQH